MADSQSQDPQSLKQPSLSSLPEGSTPPLLQGEVKPSDQPSQSGIPQENQTTSQLQSEKELKEQPNVAISGTDTKISQTPDSQEPSVSNLEQTKQEAKKPYSQPVNLATQGEPLDLREPSITPPTASQEKKPLLFQETTAKMPPPPPPPPPPPSAQPSLSSIPTIAESPQVKVPRRGAGIKKALVLFAIILAVIAGGILFVQKLIPALMKLRLPGVGQQEVTISYWGLWEPSSVLQQLIDEFNSQHSEITVKYTQQSPKDYRERLQSAIARGEGPDIFRFHNTWVPMLQDNLEPLPSEIMSASTFQQTFYSIAASDLRVGANIVGIPLEIDGLAMFYNKKIFTNAAKPPPTSWEQLRKTAFELTIRDQTGKIQTAGVALGTTNNIDHWPDILGLMMLQNGADLANPTDELASDALLFYTLFNRSDKVWDETLPNSTQAFAAEKVAIYFGPSWRIIDIKALNPNLDFGVLPVPQLSKSNITWASYWVEGVSNKSERKNEAWQFLEFLSRKESLEIFYAAAVASGRPIGEPYSRIDMADMLNDDQLVGAYITQAPNAKSWYMASATHDNGINDRIIKYFEDAVNAVNQRAEPEDALQTASQGISQILSQYRLK